MKALFNPRGTIHDDEIEIAKSVHYASKRLRREQCAILGRRKYFHRAFSVVYKRLKRSTTSRQHVPDVVDDSSLDSRHDVEIVESHVSVNEYHSIPVQSKFSSERSGDGGLAHPALAGSNNNFSHTLIIKNERPQQTSDYVKAILFLSIMLSGIFHAIAKTS